MSATATASHPWDVVRYRVGVGFRIGIDIMVTTVVWFFLCTAAGMSVASVNARHDWRMMEVGKGFANVLVPMIHMDVGGVVMAVLGNFFCLATFSWAVAVPTWALLVFTAYALWRSYWVGGTFFVFALPWLGYLVVTWALQILGPFAVIIPIATAIVGLVLYAVVKLFNTMWGWANKKSH